MAKCPKWSKLQLIGMVKLIYSKIMHWNTWCALVQKRCTSTQSSRIDHQVQTNHELHMVSVSIPHTTYASHVYITMSQPRFSHIEAKVLKQSSCNLTHHLHNERRRRAGIAAKVSSGRGRATRQHLGVDALGPRWLAIRALCTDTGHVVLCSGTQLLS